MGNHEADKHCLTLYIGGENARSRAAINNLEEICNEDLDEQYEIEVVDIRENPGVAEEEDIVAVPTLIKYLPPPLRRIIGDLSRKEKVIVGLDLKTKQ